MSENIKKPIQKRAFEKKARLLEAAKNLFDENGFYNTYIKDIAHEAGVSIGLFYNYFTDKKDIYMEVIQTICEKEITKHKNLKNKLLIINDKEKVIRQYIESSLESNSNKKILEEINIIKNEFPEIQDILEKAQDISQQIFEEILLSLWDDTRNSKIKVSANIIRRTFNANILTILNIDDKELQKEYIEELVNLIYKYILN